MKLHLVDGTYELFRNYFGAPPRKSPEGREVGAVLGLVRTLFSLLSQEDVTHVGVAFDHVVRSFRNDLYAGYKSEAGVPQELLDQFHPAEDAAAALGLVVWPGIRFEADDYLAAAAQRWSDRPEVEQVVICTPDKDLAQCIRGSRVVSLDRRRQIVLDEEGVREKFGVGPRSIPDWLALVGDSADGFPGVPRWGAKSAAIVLSRFEHLERIPLDEREWGISVRGAEALARSLRGHREEAELFKVLATLRTDVPIEERLEDLRWTGVDSRRCAALAERLGSADLFDRPPPVKS